MIGQLPGIRMQGGVLSSQPRAAGAKRYTGTMVLNGKNVNVEVVYHTFSRQEKIAVGDEEYKVTSEGTSGFDGSRKVLENGRPVVDKNVSINMDPAALNQLRSDPQAVAKALGLKNAAEFKCAPGDNALIIVGDNLTGEVSANCACLRAPE